MTRLVRIAFVALVLALAAFGVATAWQTGADGRWLRVALAVAITLPLLLLPRHPVAVVLVVVGAASTDLALGGGGGGAWFAMLVVAYGLGRYSSGLALLLGGVAMYAAALAADLPRLRSGAPLDEVVPAWVILAALVGLGHWFRSRQEETAELVGRAAADERGRIARELHDLVAHSLAVTVVQAQAGQRVLDRDPEAARTALAAVERLSREGLGELRRLLGMLENDDSASVDPPPSLARLDELVADVRAAGLPVHLTVRGSPAGLPAGVDLAAYRIAQEGLTNVLKHAGPGAQVDLTVFYEDDAVEVQVVDDGRGNDGRGGNSGGAGRGLVGMRQRVALYGGSLEAGPRNDGGFEVRARMPLVRA
ncbi:histidine kinase [Knoellia sp. S7-12]|uniref:sensor histidine kinase n=1 Tax=Knoellia sp. S7-12 TaxID=3126698 RepID=UPI0033693BB6